MKQQRHKHKESFSILLISNMGQSSKQFHVSLTFVRVFLITFLPILFILLGFLIYRVSTEQNRQNALQAQLETQTARVMELEAEKETLSNENQTLSSEIESLQQTIADAEQKAELEAAAEAEKEADSQIPSRYPCAGSGIMTTTYSDEQPYLAINVQSDGHIVAAGDGTVSSVGSDDTYPLIIEVTHANGYVTRYMCRKNAQMQLEEGAQVLSGAILCTVTSDDTELDYQIVYEGTPIDPLSIIKAKG